jgi:hypothetical protein
MQLLSRDKAASRSIVRAQGPSQRTIRITGRELSRRMSAWNFGRQVQYFLAAGFEPRFDRINAMCRLDSLQRCHERGSQSGDWTGVVGAGYGLGMFAFHYSTPYRSGCRRVSTLVLSPVRHGSRFGSERRGWWRPAKCRILHFLQRPVRGPLGRIRRRTGLDSRLHTHRRHCKRLSSRLRGCSMPVSVLQNGGTMCKSGI